MKTLNIKCHFPGNFFHSRKVRVIVGDQIVRVSSGQEVRITVDSVPDVIIAKIDMYRSKHNLHKEDRGDLYFTLRYKGDTPFQRFLASFTRGAIQLSEVDQAMFDSFSEDVYSTYPRAAGNLDGLSMIVTLMLALFFGYRSILESQKDLAEYLIFASLLGIVTVATIFFDKKKMALNDAYLRIALTNLVYVAAVIWFSFLELNGVWVIGLVVMVPLYRSLPNIFRPVDFYSKLKHNT